MEYLLIDIYLICLFKLNVKFKILILPSTLLYIKQSINITNCNVYRCVLTNFKFNDIYKVHLLKLCIFSFLALVQLP